MDKNYDSIIQERADHVFEVMAQRVSAEELTRINGRLEPVTATLRRGDVIEIFTDDSIHPGDDWDWYAHTYKSRKAIRRYRESIPHSCYCRCEECNPIPGEEVIGIRNLVMHDMVTIHRRDCERAITMAS